MTGRWRAVALLALLCTVAGLTATGPADAASKKWRTCKPGTKENIGAYRVFDNAWVGPSSRRFCVHSTGLNISIDSQAAPYGKNVVAYPSVRFGAFWSDLDPQSGLPVRVTRIGTMTLTAASHGRASGVWLSDADVWFRPRSDWTQHGTFELVIVNRSGGFGAPPKGRTASALIARPAGPGAAYAMSGHIVRIRGVAYQWNEWITHDPKTGLQWPILVFRQVRQTVTATDRVGAFVWFARQHGFLHRSAWLGDVAYGSELWSGGRGLTDSMTVDWPCATCSQPDGWIATPP